MILSCLRLEEAEIALRSVRSEGINVREEIDTIVMESSRLTQGNIEKVGKTINLFDNNIISTR